MIDNFIDKVICGDCLTVLKTIPDESIDCCITSPPYWGLRDYGVDGQLGLEKTPEEYVEKLVQIFREVRRVLKKKGTLWVVLGDSYAGSNQGHGTKELSKKQASNIGTQWMTGKTLPRLPNGLKPKDLAGIPWRTAFALQADGWYLRQDIIWSKANPMPESIKDRCTKSHEYVFLLAKSQKYYFDSKAIREENSKKWTASWGDFKRKKIVAGQINNEKTKGEFDNRYRKNGRNKRSVWTITTKPFNGAHFAVFPPDLIEPMVKAGCPKDGIVLDPFIGSGTTGLVAKKLGRNYIGIELNPEYCEMAKKRIEESLLPLLELL